MIIGKEGLLPVPHLDDSSWPLVIFTAVGTTTDADHDDHLADVYALLGRREPFGIVFDLSSAAPITAVHRKKQVDWMVRNHSMIKTYLICIGFVMPSAIWRGVLRAILWMHPLPFAHVVEDNVGAATRWVSRQLSARSQHHRTAV
jgi:hypothetical protein